MSDLIRDRHTAIGIKQVVRLEWMQQTTNLLLAGLDVKTIRQELHEFLTNKKGNGSVGDRSDQTRAFTVSNLMKTWVSPDSELLAFRDAALAILRDLPAPCAARQAENPSLALAVHWGMISAAYPFWFNVARQTGRLLALQEQVTQAQIIHRLKEQYGDRQTVSRYTQYVIRSFVAWEVLRDCNTMGCYEKVAPVRIADPDLAILMCESALLATPEGKGALRLLLNNSAFFPFQLRVMSGDFVSQRSERIDVVHYGLDDELLELTVK